MLITPMGCSARNLIKICAMATVLMMHGTKYITLNRLRPLVMLLRITANIRPSDS